MNALFGLELPTPVNFVIAFVVVLALIGAATWAVRRFGTTRLEPGSRNRQPRLAVIDTAAVDSRRKLVIIRRDNVEHLLMIGGPSDVLIEANIVRGAAVATRDAPGLRANGGETLPRAIPSSMPMPETPAWSLQPEPAAAPAPVRLPERIEEAPQWSEEPVEPEPVPAPVARPQRNNEALAGLAVEPPQPPAPAPAPAPAPVLAPAPAPRPAPPIRAVPKPVPVDPHVAAAQDANLASMAHQLEAALRRPGAPEPVRPAAPAAAAAPAPAVAKRVEPRLSPIPAAAPRPAPVPKPAAVGATPAAAPQKAPFENLEQEMASLLGRPGKP